MMLSAHVVLNIPFDLMYDIRSNHTLFFFLWLLLIQRYSTNQDF